MRSKEAASGRFCRCCRLHIFDSLSLFLCSICTIARIISTVKRWVLIILWRFCEALILRASQRFFTCFRTRFSWFDHIFTTKSWKNIFGWMLLNWWKFCSGLMNLIPVWSISFNQKLIQAKNQIPVTIPLYATTIPIVDLLIHLLACGLIMGFLMIFWKNGLLEKKNWNLVKLPEMSILNGKSTGRRLVMIVENVNLQSNGDAQTNRI